MKKILLSALLTLCLVLTLMPMTVFAVGTTSVTVGGVTLTYTDIPVYATTNGSGVVTTDGATAGNYNIKFENTTLTLRNAKISYNSGTAIWKGGALTIVADGGNSVVESGAGNPTILADNLTLEGSGTLTVTSERNTAIFGDASLNVQGDITLTAVGGPAPGQIGGPALYSNNNVFIQDNATVTAMGGASSSGNGSPTGSTGIWGIRTVLIQGNASITAVGGDTTATGYSSGILSGSEHFTGFTGSITIGGSAKVVAVGGKSNIASYGLYASSTGAITYNGGLLVARGDKATSTSLAMNKAATGGALDSAEVTNNNGTSDYCVISPKTNEIADYYLVASSVTSSTGNMSGHITWDGNNNLILNNTVIIGDSPSLTIPDGKTLNISGFNVVLGGDSGGSSYGLSWLNYNNGNIITGGGSLVAIGGSANGGPSVGIGNVSTISTSGRITAIGGSSSNSSSHGVRTIYSNITTIITGSGVALAGIPGEGGDAWSFSSAPSTSGLSTTGAYNGKVMTWRPVSTINISTITGVTPPVAGSVPVTSITETDQYTGTVTWSGGPSAFDYSTAYTATITLSPKTDYTLTGIAADFFTVTGADTVTNGAASGVVIAVFPETASAPPSGGGGGGGGGGAASTLITKIDTGGTVTGTNVDNLVKEGKSLTVDGKSGETLVFDTEALKTINAQTKDTVKVEIKDVSSDYIHEHPGRLVVSLTVTAGDQRITNFGNGTATISLPYDLKEGEKAEDVTVWYLAEDGTMTEVPCTYNPETKLATFQVNHFSLYLVGTADISLWVNPFSDVAETRWYYDAVRYVSANGLMNGTADTAFNPNGKTSRGMIVTILWRMENQPSSEKEMTFTDVKSGKYYWDAVAWGSEKGIVSGYSENRFGPEDNITREQLAVILHNYAVSKGIDTESTADLGGFVDSTTIHDWALDAMMWANGEGLINGVGNSKLSPLGSAERCQVAAILQRFIQN